MSFEKRDISPRVTRIIDEISGAEKTAQFAELLDRSFSVPSPGRFFHDFPVWDEQHCNDPEKILRIGIWEGRSLVSCAGVRLAMMHAPAGMMQVALIGAVATADTHRGLGLASNALRLAVQWAEERRATLAILWGHETGLYQRLGFSPCGDQARVLLEHLELGPVSADALRIHTGWNPVLLKSLQKRGSGLMINLSDGHWLAAHRNVEWYWMGPADAPIAYAAIGRGIDLHDIVHEWGGTDQSALRELLRAIRERRPEAMLLGSPWMLRALGHEPENVETLCLAKILDAQRIREHYGDQAELARLPLWIWGLDAV